MKNKEFKLVLVESNPRHNHCQGCIFDVSIGCCNEPDEIDCDTMRPNKSKKYHWELEEIKQEQL